MCGTYPEEWQADRNAYYVEAFRCQGCEKVEAEQDAWSRDDATNFGIKFRLKKPD